MKKMLFIRRHLPEIILLAITFTFYSSCIQAADIVRIMPLGDSITKGVLGSEYGWGYRKPLYDNLTAGGYDFNFVGSKADGSFPAPNHEGHDGWRADEILNGRTSEPGAGKLQDWMNSYQPDVVLLHIGTNDITAGNQDANEINAILNVIDTYENSSGRHVTVLVALIINRATYSLPTTIYNNDVNNMALNRIAGGDDIIIVNMENALEYPADLVDSIHPNAGGYVKMANAWYNALAGFLVRQGTLTCSSTVGGTMIQPGAGTFEYDNGSIVDMSAAADVNYFFIGWTGTAVSAGKVSDANSISTTVTVDGDYTAIANFVQNGTNRLEEINHRLELRANGDVDEFTAFFAANGWDLDVAEDMALRVDFHYSGISVEDGWVGMNVGDDTNSISISAGSDGGQKCFYYETVVDGNVVSQQEPRTSDDGTFYISFDSVSRTFYLSHIGFGSEYANFQVIQGQWGEALTVTLGGGSYGAVLGPGQAYLDNYETVTAKLLDWPPPTDVDKNGFIEIDDLAVICENWLENGQGDIDSDEIVDFYDLAEFGLAW